MSKNDKLINNLKEIARRNREQHIKEASERDTPQIYAAIAIALYRLLDVAGEDEKVSAINAIFAESQSVWMECVSSNKDVCQMCIDETGIDVQYQESGDTTV